MRDNSPYVSRVSLQEKIREALESEVGEGDISRDFRIEISTYGKPSHLWKILLALSRLLHVNYGTGIKILTLENDELFDDPKDDDDPTIELKVVEPPPGNGCTIQWMEEPKY